VRRAGSKTQNEIKTRTPLHASMPTRASHPSVSSIFSPTTFPNYENTRFLEYAGGGDGLRFRLPLFGADSRFLVSDQRFLSLLRLAAVTYAGHNICGQMVSVPLPSPSLSLSLSRHSTLLPTAAPPRSRSATPAHSISGFPCSCRAAPQRQSIRKSSGHPPRARAREYFRLLPTPKISRDSSNHPARHSSIMRTVVLSPTTANHL